MSPGSRSELLRSAFVLPADVLVFPVAELAPRVRSKLGCEDGDFAVTRPGFRTLSRIVDRETAALLEEFRQPTPIVEAVLRLSRGRRDPEELLAAAFPVLQAFSAALVLVPEGSAWAEGVEASFAAGQMVAGYEVRRLIQALDDTELYQARGPDGAAVALKIARGGASSEVRRMIDREAAILDHLGGVCCPRLVASGSFRDRPFLASRWLAGVPVSTRAGELRSMAADGWREKLHRLACRVLGVYRRLHERGVVHGDVHPRNLLVDADDVVHVLDFGLSRFPGAGPGEGRAEHDHGRRAGLAWFLEPEAAAALLRGEMPPRASFAGEQYAVAALVYFLLCGEHHLDAAPEREALYRELLAGAMLPFARRGFESWPQVERVLARAAARRPEDRYGSLAELLAAFRASPPPPPRPAIRRQPAPMTEAVARILQRAAWTPRPLDELFPRPPTASLQYGAAGLAWFLYRAAQVRECPRLLAAADLWSRRALARIGDRGAFEAPAVGIREDRVGAGSFYHRACGVHCVHGLVSHARGDLRAAAAEIERFVAAAGTPGEPAELAFGGSGGLLGGALLLEAARSSGHLDTEPLARFLRRGADALWSRLAQLPRLGECSELPHLGIAHGWGGILYAQLRLRQALDAAPPDGLRRRLAELARRAEPVGRGVSWIGTLEHPGRSSQTPAHAPGWCSGSAGHVHLWTLAHETFGDPRYLDLAERAAWHAWEHPDRHPRLCCGLSGRAFALLRLYRHTGERSWLDRAGQLAVEAGDRLAEVTGGDRELSLFWGALGPALLAIELERPERSAMPAFDGEGWPSPAREPVVRAPSPPPRRRRARSPRASRSTS